MVPVNGCGAEGVRPISPRVRQIAFGECSVEFRNRNDFLLSNHKRVKGEAQRPGFGAPRL